MKKIVGSALFSTAAAASAVLFGLFLALGSSSGCSGKTGAAGQGAAAPVAASPAAPEQRLQDERPARGFNGPVRRATAKRFRPAPDGSGKLAPGGSSVISFDKDGRFLSEEFYGDDGRKASSVRVSRGKDGRPAGEETRSASGALESKVAFSYGENGKPAEETYFAPDGKPTGAYRYEYDREGKLAKRTMRAEYSDGSTRVNEVDYRYDEAGRLLEETYAEESLGLVLRIEHIYRNGVRIRSADYQRGSWLEFLTFYDYDKLGNRVRETTFQIPENEYGDSFQSTTSQETLPRTFLSSETIWEYEFHENR